MPVCIPACWAPPIAIVAVGIEFEALIWVSGRCYNIVRQCNNTSVVGRKVSHVIIIIILILVSHTIIIYVIVMHHMYRTSLAV